MPGAAKVDPSCAICRAPAGLNCQCEAQAFEVAVAQAEDRFFKPTYNDVRSWVRRRAKDYILAYFHLISEPCKDAYSLHLDTIKSSCLAHHHAAPSPAHLARAEAEYRHNIDRAWSLAVKRYPEVLDYFYSLVHISLPDDSDPAVQNPPMDRLGDLKLAQRRLLFPKHEAPTPVFPIPPLPPMMPPFVHAEQWQTTPPPSPHFYGRPAY